MLLYVSVFCVDLALWSCGSVSSNNNVTQSRIRKIEWESRVKEGDMRMRASTRGDCVSELEEEKGSRRAEGYWIAPVSSRNDFSMTPGMWSRLSLGISSVYAQAKTRRLGSLVFTWLKWPSCVNLAGGLRAVCTYTGPFGTRTVYEQFCLCN